jgi:hypothetical protein
MRRFGNGCSALSSSSESSSARKPPRTRGFGGFGASDGRGLLVVTGDELAGKVIGEDDASIVAQSRYPICQYARKCAKRKKSVVVGVVAVVEFSKTRMLTDETRFGGTTASSASQLTRVASARVRVSHMHLPKVKLISSFSHRLKRFFLQIMIGYCGF